MSDENSDPSGPIPPAGQQPPSYPGQGTPQPPSWGNAYPPPPGGAYPPPPGAYPPPGYGQQYPAFQQAPPKHPNATTSMVLGIVSLAGAFACVLPILLAPVAWILGAKAVRGIDANPGAYSGRGEASAGKILGIIGTVLLALMLIAVVVIIIVAVNGGFDDPSYDDDVSSVFIGAAFS